MKQAFLNQIYETKSFKRVNFGSVTNGPSSPPRGAEIEYFPPPHLWRSQSPLSQQEV